jgi:hypothetical protein
MEVLCSERGGPGLPGARGRAAAGEPSRANGCGMRALSPAGHANDGEATGLNAPTGTAIPIAPLKLSASAAGPGKPVTPVAREGDAALPHRPSPPQPGGVSSALLAVLLSKVNHRPLSSVFMEEAHVVHTLLPFRCHQQRFFLPDLCSQLRHTGTTRSLWWH